MDVEKTWMTFSKSDVFGLIKAIDNFDISQDVQSSTYGANDSMLVEIIHIKQYNWSIEVNFSHFYFFAIFILK